MKVSKITVSICALLDILVGCLIANIPETYTLALNILLGVFTGLFVSIVTSLICYFHEKITIISKAKSQLPDVYIDLLIVQQMTGSILPRIIHTYRLDDLNYRTVISISDLAVHAIDKNSLKLYSPFLQYGKKAKWQMSSNLCEKTIKYFTRRVRRPRRTRSRRSESLKSLAGNC